MRNIYEIKFKVTRQIGDIPPGLSCIRVQAKDGLQACAKLRALLDVSPNSDAIEIEAYRTVHIQ